MSPTKASGPASGIPMRCVPARCATSTRAANASVGIEAGAPMVAIAEGVSEKPASRLRFILDRRDVLGGLFVAPAIIYVLLLVGLPFLLAVYYSLSAYTVYD